MVFVYPKVEMNSLVQCADKIFTLPPFKKRKQPGNSEKLVTTTQNTTYFENQSYNYACAYYDSHNNNYTVAVGYWAYYGRFAVSFNGSNKQSAKAIKNAIESLPLPYLAEIVPIDPKYYKGYWYTILLDYLTLYSDSVDDLPIRLPGNPNIFGSQNETTEVCLEQFNGKLDRCMNIIKQICGALKYSGKDLVKFSV